MPATSDVATVVQVHTPTASPFVSTPVPVPSGWPPRQPSGGCRNRGALVVGSLLSMVLRRVACEGKRVKCERLSMRESTRGCSVALVHHFPWGSLVD